MRTRITLTDDVARNAPEFDLLALDKALDRLEKLSPRQAAIIEMRHIVGLTVEEVAGELDISERTVKGETRVAMAWLRRELDK